MNVVVETIHEGLKNDRIVKVKGFGTFKLTAVRERESINVNTGERVVISSHDKVSFTPDAVLRDLVNKPFAQFDTVVLADGVDFEDMPEIATDEMAEIPAPAPVQEEAKVVPVQVEPKPAPEPVIAPVVVPVEEVVEETVEPEVVSEPEPVVEEPVVEEPIAEEPVIEESVAEQPQPEEPETPVASEGEEIPEAPESPEVPETPENPAIPEIPEKSDAPESPSPEEEQPEEEAQEEQGDSISEFYDDENNECKKVFLMYAIIVNVIVAALFFVFGYYARSTNMLGIEKDTAVETAAPVVEQPETTTPAKAEETATAVEKKEEKPVEEKKPVAEPKKEEKTEAKAEATSKYDSDPRVRTGAYRIVGVANTVTVKSGQTIKSISKTYLGAGMECYVEAFNGGITELREGQTIKIPKLELKKKARKANK